MEEDIHYYSGDEIEVSYDVNRCIHARECVRGLPGVFDPDKRPWIEPDNADVDDLSDVIVDCPTGALQFERTDGGPDEPIPDENVIIVAPDGPLYLRGDIEIVTDDDTTLLTDTRVALCRCGASENKPLCDNSHVEVDFEAAGTETAPESETQAEDADGVLTVRPMPDGPIRIQGQFQIWQADKTATDRASSTTLCRCGGSGNKPFCDGTHSEIGFSSEDQST
ncbi:CDGSH iron-sulfur domain-containing protein [Halobaculum magnesiiphilum]|uniref:CDGSH iron-sulfur domain-containing protein n=1 Tax=Halobaculum magnesiiphilum TaxID=1017351 RepID=A0A8T8WHL1_9EURY|nr:CDGSH iron-sulfur domain-containing protein [Halobaculum magnesiiphilum]QZP39330.1 CDGSH iron-sulfur domain-containing protein [Halobaculum magnesiiphilum]